MVNGSQNMVVVNVVGLTLDGECGDAVFADEGSGDVILSIGGSTISYSSTTATDNDFYAAVQSSEGRPMRVVYQGTDGADHTATVTPELVVYAEGMSGTFPTKLAGAALVITSVNGAPPSHFRSIRSASVDRSMSTASPDVR